MEHNYTKKVLEMLNGIEPGKVFEMNVYHDDGCPRLDGGVCTCNVVVDAPKDMEASND